VAPVQSLHAQHADDVLAAATRARVKGEPLLELLEQSPDLRVVNLEMREDSGGGSFADLAVGSEQLLELLPEVEAHREVAVALALGQDAGVGDLLRLMLHVAACEL